MPPKRTSKRNSQAGGAATKPRSTKKPKKAAAPPSPKHPPAAEAPPAVAASPKKKEKKVYHLVVLGNGNWKQFSNASDFDEFMADYGDNVKASHKFSAKKLMQEKTKEVEAGKAAAAAAAAAAASTAVTIKKEKGTVETIDLTEDQKMSAEKIVRSFRENSPSDRVELVYRTTSSTKQVLVIILILDASGKLKWWFKGEDFARRLEYYVREATIDDEFLKEALTRMDWGLRRDPARDCNDILQDHIKRKIFEKGKKVRYEETGVSLDVTVPFTYLPIPVENIGSTAEETEWIESELKKLARSIIDLHKSSLYKAVLQGTLTGPQWLAMTKPERQATQTYDQFFNTCVTRVTRCENLNTILIRKSVTEAMQVLLDDSMPNYGKKYPSLLDSDALAAVPEKGCNDDGSDSDSGSGSDNDDDDDDAVDGDNGNVASNGFTQEDQDEKEDENEDVTA